MAGRRSGQRKSGPRRGGFKRKKAKITGGLNKRRRKQLTVDFGEVRQAKEDCSESAKRRQFRDRKNSTIASSTNTAKKTSSDSETEQDSEVEDPVNDLISTFDSRNFAALKDFDSDEEEVDDEPGVEQEEAAAKESGVAVETGNEEVSPIRKEEKEEEPKEEMSENDEVDEAIREEDDPFCTHFEVILKESIVQKLTDKVIWEAREVKFPVLGRSTYSFTRLVGDLPFPSKHESSDLEKLWIKRQLFSGWRALNKIPDEGLELFTPLQQDVFSIVNSYADLLFYGRNYANGEEIRSLYCLHVLNHVLKTRARVVHHNSKLSRREEVPEEYRDQGLTRPKVLILVPFREAALRIVGAFTTLLSPDDRANVINKKRFQNEFGDPSSGTPAVKRISKPPDHEATFAGNVDDNFRLGIAITKKSIRLYADFYGADVLLASPLGLRILLGVEGEKDRDYDFLSSIEIFVVDQADVMMMQNWEHVLHCFNHLHLQPLDSHGVDFSRIRLWTLNGWAKHYRQTLCFTSFVAPEVNALFTRHCCNYAGILRLNHSIVGGSIRQVAVQLPQVFQRFQSTSLMEDPNARFRYFTTKILPQYREAVMSGTLIFVSSYFDFVRLRNHLRKEDFSFVQICEYGETGKVAQARDRFCHRERKFLLYTERAHFYHRYRIKGIRNVIFYQLPLFPHFYSELCNLTGLTPSSQTSAKAAVSDQNLTCTVVYSHYDAHRLAAIVGTERAGQMFSSDQNVHLFVTGDS